MISATTVERRERRMPAGLVLGVGVAARYSAVIRSSSNRKARGRHPPRRCRAEPRSQLWGTVEAGEGRMCTGASLVIA